MATTNIIFSGGDVPAEFSVNSEPSESLKKTLILLHSRRQRDVRLAASAASARRDLEHSWSEIGSWLVAHEPFSLAGVPERSNVFISSSSLRVKMSQLSLEPYPVPMDGDADKAELQTLLEATMKELLATSSALSELAAKAARQLVGHPGKLVSGTELAGMLGVSEEAVRQRHQAGKLVAILSEGRERGRGFPVFQSWTGVTGARLEQILGALGYRGPAAPPDAMDAADAFQFFTSCNEMLGGFTPVQVLIGAGVHDASDKEAADFLAKPYEERFELVMSVARAEADLQK